MKYALFLFVMLFTIANSQMMNKSSSQTIVKGKIVDSSGKPVGLEINIQPEKGAKFVIKSNPETGAYEQLLNANQEYTLQFIHPEFLRENFKYTVPEADEDFNPVIKDFVATRLIAGNEILSGTLFGSDSFEMTKQGKRFLKNLKMTLRFNRTMKVNFNVYGKNGLDAKRLEAIQKATAKWKREKRNIIFNPSGEQKDTDDVKIVIESINLK